MLRGYRQSSLWQVAGVRALGWLLLGFGWWLFAIGACGPKTPDESGQQELPASNDAQGGADIVEPGQPQEPLPVPDRGVPPEPAGDDVAAVPDRRLPPPDNAPPERRQPPAEQPPVEQPPVEQPTPETPATSWVYPKQPFNGKATWYNADGTGNCSFPKATAPPMVAAMNESQYGDAAFCGACVRVTGPKGSVVVTITDRCPECPANHLDLSQQAFAKLSDPKVGVIAISWQVIPCEPAAPMQYFYKDGSSQWWTAIQVRRHRLPIAKLEAFKGGKWVVLKRERYNFFVDPGGLGDQPVTLRIHALDGQQREETIPAPSSSTLITGKQQF